jgi:hypothetical protein
MSLEVRTQTSRPTTARSAATPIDRPLMLPIERRTDVDGSGLASAGRAYAANPDVKQAALLTPAVATAAAKRSNGRPAPRGCTSLGTAHAPASASRPVLTNTDL